MSEGSDIRVSRARHLNVAIPAKPMQFAAVVSTEERRSRKAKVWAHIPAAAPK